MPRSLALFARFSLAAALTLPLWGCGGDDDDGPGPIEPPPPSPGLRVPEDYATLIDALAFAASGDTVSLAPGLYTVDASIDRAVTIRGREPGVVLTDSRLTVRATGPGAVLLEDLAFAGGDTALVVQSDITVMVARVDFDGLALAILHGGGGTMTVGDAGFTDLGPVGAVHAQGAASLNLHRVTIRDCEAGDRGVIWAGEAAGLSITAADIEDCTASQAVVNLETALGVGLLEVRFTDCIPYAVRQRARDLWLEKCVFVGLTQGALAVGAGSVAEADSCTFQGGRWPQIEVGGELELRATVIAGGVGDGPAVMIGDGGEVRFELCTVYSGEGPWVSVGSAATLAAERTIVTSVAVPFVRRLDVAPAQLDVDVSDLWHPTLDAWTELEAVRDDGQGNVSVDPLYCDPEAGDLRLQTGTPVPQMGALGVGCQ